jgi:hypothetical protein
MTPFEEVMDVGFLRAGLLASLGCEPGSSVEEAAANMVMAWPRLAELWPSDSPGREIVSLGLIDGPRGRSFRGMEYPPLLSAVRWCLLTQGVSALEMRPHDGKDLFLPSSYDTTRSMAVHLYHADGAPECGATAARRKIETIMRGAIGSSFTDLTALSTETIPYISNEWKRTYHLSWHLPTDRMQTSLAVSKEGGSTRERHAFDLSSKSTDHLDRFIILVMPLMDKGSGCTSS